MSSRHRSATSSIISLTLSSDLLARIDSAAKATYRSRSDYIRHATVLQLELDQRRPAATSATTKLSAQFTTHLKNDIPSPEKLGEEEFLRQLEKRYR